MISPHHQCIFVHIPKCGGQSIETAFLDQLGLTWEQRGALLLSPNVNPRKGPPRLAHLSFQEYLDLGYLSESEFRDYFSFTIVRNPFRRIESLYGFLGYDCAMRFSDFIQGPLSAKVSRSSLRQNYFFRPQVEFLKGHSGEIEVDRVLKLEEPERILECLSKFGIHALPHHNRRQHRKGLRRFLCRTKHLCMGQFSWSLRVDPAIRWKPEDIKKATQLFWEDFELLGYSKIPP